jgi:DNA-directed RNA polymerase specialized sigma24 family protein
LLFRQWQGVFADGFGSSTMVAIPEFSQSLTELERRLLLRYIAGWKYQQMAEETGMPESTLRSKITRIKEKYKKRYL